MQFYKPHVH